MHIAPLYKSSEHCDIKDPCLVFDGTRWHIFGSGGSTTDERWGIHHATSYFIGGPWTQHDTIFLDIYGSGVAAPGVIYEHGMFHMFIQTEFMKPDGLIHHLLSDDGFTWEHSDIALGSLSGTDEHGIYDPHPAIINGEKYIVYSGMPPFDRMPRPDVYLAKSRTGTWYGPWQRLGKILDHTCVAAHHNQHDHEDYEWGIEGAQLLELPNGKVVLTATSFLPVGARGERQRVFLAVGDNPCGPFKSLGPVINTTDGENGHSSIALYNNRVILCYQYRPKGSRWKYGVLDITEVLCWV